MVGAEVIQFSLQVDLSREYGKDHNRLDLISVMALHIQTARTNHMLQVCCKFDCVFVNLICKPRSAIYVSTILMDQTCKCSWT